MTLPSEDKTNQSEQKTKIPKKVQKKKKNNQ